MIDSNIRNRRMLLTIGMKDTFETDEMYRHIDTLCFK